MRYFMLDPFRGLAALWVLVFHYQFSDQFQQSCPTLYSFFKLGDLGVPMFFVISGYCICASARSSIRRDESTASFLRRRVKRIYPPFWCSIVVVVAIPYLMALISSFKTGTFQAPRASETHSYGFIDYSLFEWGRVVTLTQAFWIVDGASTIQFKFSTINAVYWTLALEVQFYVVVAVGLWTPRKYFYRFLAITTAVCLPFLTMNMLWVSGVFIPYWPMFALGVGLCFVFERRPTANGPQGGYSHIARACGAIGLLVAFVWAVMADVEVAWFTFAVGFTALLWLLRPFDDSFAATSKHRFWRFVTRPMVFVGLMSYSLYLVHGKVMHLVAMFVRRVFEPESIVHDVLVLILTCLVCAVFFLCCEAPFFKPRKNSKANPPSTIDLEAKAIQLPDSKAKSS